VSKDTHRNREVKFKALLLSSETERQEIFWQAQCFEISLRSITHLGKIERGKAGHSSIALNLSITEL